MAVAAFCLTGAAFAADVPAFYPADYAKVIEAAEKEGKVVIYSATDAAAAQPLLKAFAKAFPKITVDYNDLNSTELYNRLIAEAAAGGTGDVLWSSAMDLQIKLAQDGYAMTYASPEKPKLPGWSVYKDQAYGTTFEPVVFVYNKRLLPEAQVPKTHDEFVHALTDKKAALTGKVATYDPERSGIGFAYLSNDQQYFPGLWDLAAALGGVSVKFPSSTGTMLERISSGEHVLGYNMIGSYAFIRGKRDPNIGVIYPQDYTAVSSRVMLIPAKAKNPNAAKVFLNYVLSLDGQKAIADSGLFAMRDDVEGEATAKALKQKLGDRLKPIPVDDSTTQYLDQTKRLAFLKTWQDAVAKH